MKSQKMIGRIGVELNAGTFLGDTRIRLLEAIDRCGSISQAAKEVPLSYKAAWDAVDAMNNLSDQPLVERAVGGRHGGGTVLTEYGKRLVGAYRIMESEYQMVLDKVSASLARADSEDPAALRRLLRNVSVSTSARNQFVGPVTSLRAGDVTYEVGIRFDGRHEIIAQISAEGAEQMQLNIGRELHAWVNSAAVILNTDDSVRLSARNQLWGEVTRIHEGPVAVDVVLSLPGGRTVSSIITRESLKELDLREGSRACAVFKAATVTLCAFD